jgi:hypothetical protein
VLLIKKTVIFEVVKRKVDVAESLAEVVIIVTNIATRARPSD